MKAESMRRAREARSAADLAHAEAAMEAATSGNSSAARRTVGGRVFEMRNGVWTDLGIRNKMAPIEIEPFSTACFALLRALPELQPVWKALPSSVTGGNRISIAVKAGGKKQLTQVELQNLVMRFRS